MALSGLRSPSGCVVASKAFPCPNCPATFSSQRTLDGHLEFYCSVVLASRAPSTPSSEATARNYTTKTGSGSTSKGRAANTRSAAGKPVSLEGAVVAELKLPSELLNSSSKLCSFLLGEKMRQLCANNLELRHDKLLQQQGIPDQSRVNLASDHDANWETGNKNVVEDRIGQQSAANCYECRFCAYSSPYKGNLKRHMTLMHREESLEKDDPWFSCSTLQLDQKPIVHQIVQIVSLRHYNKIEF